MFDLPELKSMSGLNVAVQLSKPENPTALILHGYGANAYDLWSLRQELTVESQLNWYFPNGILGLNMGPGYSGRAWFPINERALEQAALTGKPLDYSQIYPPGLDRARDVILNWIAKENIKPDRLVLGGFSQGGMLALEVALHLPQPPLALLLLSSTLANATQMKTLAEKLAAQGPVHFFQSHGHNDPVLPFEGAERLRDLLEGAGWKCDWQEFSGGHEIPRSVLKSASFYLKKRLASL